VHPFPPGSCRSPPENLVRREERKQAMEELGGLVRIHVLSPPTLLALREQVEKGQPLSY
jgi:hypothetical protein